MTVPQEPRLRATPRPRPRLRHATLLCALSLALGPALSCGSSPSAAPPIDPSPGARILVAPDAAPWIDALSRAAFGARDEGALGVPELVIAEEGPAYAALVRGGPAAIVVNRPPSAEERRIAEGEELVLRDPLVAASIARDAVVLLVSPDHSPDVLLFDEAVALLGGARTEWGPGLPVTLWSPTRASSSRALVVSDLLGGRPLHASVREVGTAADAAARASARQGSLAIGSLAAARGARPLSLRTPDGLVLEPRTAAETGEWPLMRPVLVVTQGPVHPQVRALIAFAEGSAGRQVLRDQGLFPPAAAAAGAAP